MSIRIVAHFTAMAAAITAGVVHWNSTRAHSLLNAEISNIRAEAAKTRRLNAKTAHQVTAARNELEKLLTDRMKRPTPAPGTRPSSNATTPATNAQPTAVSSDPELRRMQIQAFVSEQRLRFAALLKRLGFTAEKVGQFDDIQRAYQQAMLDGAQTEPSRQQARQARDARLKEPFGSDWEHWVEANRHEPARAMVTQIVQQTFPSSGALTTAQADELTRIVGQHRIPPSKETGNGPTRYNWDQIIADARTFLADRQMDDFVAAIEYRRTSEKMTALAAKRK